MLVEALCLATVWQDAGPSLAPGFEIVEKIFRERYRSNRELLKAKNSMVKF
jgi:hypothetical protein